MAENHNEEKMEIESLMKIEPEIEPKSKPPQNSQEYFLNISGFTIKASWDSDLSGQFWTNFRIFVRIFSVRLPLSVNFWDQHRARFLKKIQKYSL